MLNLNYFINLAGKLEGYKTRLKEIHWCAPSHSIHVITDAFSSELAKFEDDIIENSIASLDFIKPGDIKPVLPSVDNVRDFKSLLEDIRGVLVVIKRDAEEDIRWTGIINIVDDFFTTVNKYIYLDKVSEHYAEE